MTENAIYRIEKASPNAKKKVWPDQESGPSEWLVKSRFGESGVKYPEGIAQHVADAMTCGYEEGYDSGYQQGWHETSIHAAKAMALLLKMLEEGLSKECAVAIRAELGAAYPQLLPPLPNNNGDQNA